MDFCCQLIPLMVHINPDVMSIQPYNSNLQYIFRPFILNIECGKIVDNLDESGDKFASRCQKVLIFKAGSTPT